jgi:asparagine synthase (glutamine-hydrolysing)
MGFVTVYNTDGAAIDSYPRNRRHALIDGRTAQVLGTQRHVAFLESEAGSQEPLACVGLHRFFFIGNVRLDRRKEFCSACFGAVEQEPDALLCLRAYARWGDRCLEHLAGDFCFVLWDEDRQRLLCGRDQLGVRPLFYATEGTSLIVSDSIDLITPFTSSNLDDCWIADFLTSGVCIDADRTVYKDIKRLPPAHYLTAAARSFAVHRYWQLEVKEPIYYAQRKQYVDHFEHVLTQAIKDRLPPGRVGILMSGGLDSPTLAAHTLRVTGDASRVVAYTHHLEHLMPDQEKCYASLVAKRLGIPLVLRAVDDSFYDPNWHVRGNHTPEPSTEIIRAAPRRMIAAEMAEWAPVWFCGEGPDNALVFEWQAYLRWLVRVGDWRHLCVASFQYLMSKHARDWWSSLRRYTVANCGRNRPIELPPWISGELVNEIDLVTRANQSNERHSMHPWHPWAFASFTGALWPSFFEAFHIANWGIPLTYRHPYLDLRVLNFLLSVPPIPWARRKRLIREAMQGILPDEVLHRDKSPLARDPEAISIQKYGLPRLSRQGAISRYIDPAKVSRTISTDEAIHPLINVYVLDSWLQSHERRASKIAAPCRRGTSERRGR